MQELLTLDDAERLAEAALPPDAWAYIAGGRGTSGRCAGTGRRSRASGSATACSSTSRTSRRRRRCSGRRSRCRCSSHRWPIRRSRTRITSSAWRAGQPRPGRLCLSTVATATPPAVAEAAGGAALWLQLYVFRDREVSDDVISGALANGFSALVLTADLPVVGIRDRELRTEFGAPELEVPACASARARNPGDEPGLSLLDAGLEWGYVTELRERWNAGRRQGARHRRGRRPRLCARRGRRRGLEPRRAPARRCRGRARRAARGRRRRRRARGGLPRRWRPPRRRRRHGSRARCASGLRRAPRPLRLALGGEKGVRQVLEILRDETENALALLGCRSPDEVTAAHVTGPVPA